MRDQLKLDKDRMIDESCESGCRDVEGEEENENGGVLVCVRYCQRYKLRSIGSHYLIVL